MSRSRDPPALPTAPQAGQGVADGAWPQQSKVSDQVTQVRRRRRPGQVTRTRQQYGGRDSQERCVLQRPQPDPEPSVGCSPHHRPDPCPLLPQPGSARRAVNFQIRRLATTAPDSFDVTEATPFTGSTPSVEPVTCLGTERHAESLGLADALRSQRRARAR
jgi:hypothetical protein